MELDINQSAISIEQAHSFAVLMVEDIKSYIKEHTFEFISWLLEDLTSNVIQTEDGMVTVPISAHKYNLCRY